MQPIAGKRKKELTTGRNSGIIMSLRHMTIVEIKNQIIGHFYDKDSFSLEPDAKKIELSDDLEPIRGDIVKSVLTDLETIGMVKRVGDTWILAQSFESFNQSVVITAPVGEAICETIDGFREANDIGGDAPDKTKITEADLMNLVNIIQVLLQSGDESFDDGEDGS